MSKLRVARVLCLNAKVSSENMIINNAKKIELTNLEELHQFELCCFH